ncbi:hypothetical protein YC2023_121908 [Brassica napus]
MRFFECLLLLLLLLCSTSISTHFRSRKKMPTNLELRRPQHHFGKAQKPSRAVEGRHDFSAPDSAVLTLKQAAEIYGANYAAHSTISERPRNHQGRHDFSAPNSAVLTLKRAAEIYGANYAAHSTISERPRNHQGRLKGELRRPQTISERPSNHQGRLKDELRRPQHHFGKAQKPSRAVEGRHDFSAPDSAVLTLKQAAEIYGANYAAHSTISERPRNHQGRHDFSAPNSAVLTLKRAAEIYGANYAAHRPFRKGPVTIKGG